MQSVDMKRKVRRTRRTRLHRHV